MANEDRDAAQQLSPGNAPPQSIFHQAYEPGVEAPWDIKRAQSDIVALADAGGFSGEVLDIGCGPGDNAIFLATRGYRVTGVDMVPAALGRARARALGARVKVDFVQANALELDKLGRTFDTVLDSGLLHVFDDKLRAKYVASLAHVVHKGSIYHALVFSDRHPCGVGPVRMSEAMIRAAFSDGWSVKSIRPARFEHTIDPGFAEGWLATIERTG